MEIQKDYLRAYPQGDLAAQILGNVGQISAAELKMQHFKGYAAGDEVGQAGLEWTYDRWLRGRDGISMVEVDAAGQPKANAPVGGGLLPLPGDTLVTTIDAKVQAAAEQALVKGIQIAHSSGDWAANGGAAVVMDVRNGQILAMASNPTYNPKVWVGGMSTKNSKKLSAKSANSPLLSRPTQEAIAVGSTFKPFTAIAALEEGLITPSTTIDAGATYTNHGQTFHDWNPSGHGWLNLDQAITQSADTYFYPVGYKFYQRGGSILQDWAAASASASSPVSTSPTRSRDACPRPPGSASTSRPPSTRSGSPVTRSSWPSARATWRPRPCSWPRPTRRSPTAARSCSLTSA